MVVSRRAVAILMLSCLNTSSSTEGPTPVLASVECTLSTEGKQIRQYAFDANPETEFASSTNAKASDHFTLSFEKPVSVRQVTVTTGKADGKDRLNDGSLQTSRDGKTFEDAAKFLEGTAKLEANGSEIRAIRIKPNADLAHPLVIREISMESAEPIATFQYPVEFTVDVTDAPEMKDWADKVAKLCEQWYPRINAELKSEGYKPATRISITLKSDYNGVAQASGGKIIGSVKYFKSKPDDLGAMIHETCHVVQNYPGRRNPGWLVEGVADYVRFFVYEPGNAGPVNPSRAHYNDSYRTTAAFLDFVAEKYDKQLVLKLNKLMREGNYKRETFQELTGKSPKELETEWLEALRK